jgi:exodeoxyribonuclease III
VVRRSIDNTFRLQEAKVAEDKLTKEMCCVEGFQSFWACSQAKKGYSGVTTYVANPWAPTSCELDALALASTMASAGTETASELDGQTGDGNNDKKKKKNTQSGTELPRGSADDDLMPSSSSAAPFSFDGSAVTPTIDFNGQGRIVLTDHGEFVLINVYVPNAGERPNRPRLPMKLRFLAALRDRCEHLAAEGREILLVGDFNVSGDDRDVHPRIGLDNAYSKVEQQLFKSFFTCRARFADVWRRLHPNAEHVYTVWDEKTSARAFNEGLRIDYVLATPGLMERVVSCEVLGIEDLPPKFSDHAGILVELRDVTPPPPHAPCPEWVKLEKRFIDRSQRSIASFFSKKSVASGKQKRTDNDSARDATTECLDAKRRKSDV